MNPKSEYTISYPSGFFIINTNVRIEMKLRIKTDVHLKDSQHRRLIQAIEKLRTTVEKIDSELRNGA